MKLSRSSPPTQLLRKNDEAEAIALAMWKTRKRLTETFRKERASAWNRKAKNASKIQAN
jgi:hypothetical protein